jgi:effector-binding domain-containing protein
MSLCYDEEYREDDADIEVAIPVSGKIIVDEAMEVKILPECEVVSAVYKGAYENLGIAYSKIFSYAAENNLKLGSPDRLLYLNNPSEVGEEDLMTEIQCPIEGEVIK